MTILTARQVGNLWVQAGGPRSRVVEWVAIAIGESSLDDEAQSPADALGLWQIMPFNAVHYGYLPTDMWDGLLNARVAVQMSGGGTNCAAWDSAYANINASGRYTFLNWPERGSADYGNLAVAAAELGPGYAAQMGEPAPPGLANSLPAAIAQLQTLGNRSLPGIGRQAQSVTGQLARLYR